MYIHNDNRPAIIVSRLISGAVYTLLEKFWRISQFVTDGAFFKALCDEKFSQIEEMVDIFITYIFLNSVYNQPDDISGFGSTWT